MRNKARDVNVLTNETHVLRKRTEEMLIREQSALRALVNEKGRILKLNNYSRKLLKVKMLLKAITQVVNRRRLDCLQELVRF